MPEDVNLHIKLTPQGDIELASNAQSNLVIYGLLAATFEALITKSLMDRLGSQSGIVKPTEDDLSKIRKGV